MWFVHVEANFFHRIAVGRDSRVERGIFSCGFRMWQVAGTHVVIGVEWEEENGES